MQYFHRTSLDSNAVLEAADGFFGPRMETPDSEPRRRTYRSTIGEITIAIRPDGGHYTHITARTDQMGESEADKLVKRFLGLVHQRVEAAHRVRGAY